ncbi:GNAT family N-acetyltransferase [Parabacteroides sp.]
MTNKEKYRLLCNRESSLPLYSRDWWLDIVCGETQWDVLLVEEKERIIAALPIYTPHKGIISMPFYTQTMGPWFAPEPKDAKYTRTLGKHQAICKEFTEELKKYPHFLQNFNYLITDWLPFYWEGYKQTTRYTYLLKDIRDEKTLWDNMSPNIRRNITKAREKQGITVKRGISVNDFLSIQALTFERQQLSVPKGEEVLKELISVCKQRGQGDLWGAYDTEGNLHAVAFIAWQDSSAYYIAGGGDPELRSSGAHSLVLWEGIRFTAQFTTLFDFEGSMIPGVERFFREFGAIQTPFFTITRGKLSLLYKVWLKLKRWR